MDFAQLLTAFAAEYQAAAPLRYQELAPGLDPEQAWQKLDSVPGVPARERIPTEWFQLYAWKNGFRTKDAWPDEEEPDEVYAHIPLNLGDHFLNLDNVRCEIESWQAHYRQARAQGDERNCYWKEGFLPFLKKQNFGLVVIDTVGYWDGQPGQIVDFDYKSADGYYLCHENLAKWLETQLVLLREGLLVGQPDRWTMKVDEQVNGPFGTKFRRNVPLVKNC